MCFDGGVISLRRDPVFTPTAETVEHLIILIFSLLVFSFGFSFAFVFCSGEFLSSSYSSDGH